MTSTPPHGPLVAILKDLLARGSYPQPLAQSLYEQSKVTVLGCDPVVYDSAKSTGDYFFDDFSQRYLLDLFSYYAAQALGHNHPDLFDEEFLEKLLVGALNKPSSSDIPTHQVRDLIVSMKSIMPEGFKKHLFLLPASGALADCNAVKAAQDARGRLLVSQGKISEADAKRGHIHTGIIHFKDAFHGREGITQSMTNTDPIKVDYFSKFEWPRVTTPWCVFPLEGANLERVKALEAQSIAEIRAALEHPERVSAIMVETLLGEGGDMHLRKEFLQQLRAICDEHQISLIFDEVQCGMGLSGTWWLFEQMGVQPDIFTFGKKANVCGIAARDDFEQRLCGPDLKSAFNVGSRINSTFGADPASAQRVVQWISIIQKHNYLENVKARGAEFLAGLQRISAKYPAMINPRGVGLMCAFDLVDKATQAKVYNLLYNYGDGSKEKPGIWAVKRGEKAMGFRPFLDIAPSSVAYVISALEDIFSKM